MSLNGAKVFMVEDESPVAALLEVSLVHLGAEVVDAAWRLGQALDIAARTRADVAILDINLAGERVFPVAQALLDRGLPFIFATGYGREGVPEAFQHAPVVAKPFTEEDLEAALKSALGR